MIDCCCLAKLSGALNCGSLSFPPAHPNQPTVEVISQDREKKGSETTQDKSDAETKKRMEIKREREKNKEK